MSPGVATLLYDIDDTELALAALPKEIRLPARKKQKVPPVIIVGSPSRYYFVQHTFKHVRQRGFQIVYWLRTPEASELDVFNTDPITRVMFCWYTTVLPAMEELFLSRKVQRAFVVEDTCLLAAGVTCDIVDAATNDWPATLFGYGNYQKKGRGLNWHGSKGLSVTAPW